jgi:eukaryotic-like serine/threonine-protein kinase
MPDSSKLGHFNLLEEIAHGGMGTVFRAFDPTLNREVAIKVLRGDLAHDPKFLNDFLQEARSAAAIGHPHIVQIYFVGEEKAQYYIVMELLQGRTLREIIEEDGPIPEERALELTIDVVEGLRAAYKNNKMIHGDIKPANVFITEDTGAKVLDFGLSKLANVEVAPTDGIWGSPYYISPERVGQKAEDFRSDVYSLGATLFQTLTGHPPFEADTPEELAGKRLNEKPPLLRDLNPDLTRKTEEVVNKMLNKSILLRYRDYDALLEDLKDAKTEATAKRLGVDLHPELQPPPPGPELPQPKSPLPLVITAVVVVLVIVGILAFFFWPRTTQTPTPAPTPVPETPTTTTTPTPPPPPPPTPPKPPPPPKPAVRLYNVEFTLTAPDARIVSLAGEFNNWSPTATPMHKRPNGTWAATLQLAAGKYQYKLIVDGKWIPDPENPTQQDDTYGGKNSVVEIGQ